MAPRSRSSKIVFAGGDEDFFESLFPALQRAQMEPVVVDVKTQLSTTNLSSVAEIADRLKAEWPDLVVITRELADRSAATFLVAWGESYSVPVLVTVQGRDLSRRIELNELGAAGYLIRDARTALLVSEIRKGLLESRLRRTAPSNPPPDALALAENTVLQDRASDAKKSSSSPLVVKLELDSNRSLSGGREVEGKNSLHASSFAGARDESLPKNVADAVPPSPPSLPKVNRMPPSLSPALNRQREASVPKTKLEELQAMAGARVKQAATDRSSLDTPLVPIPGEGSLSMDKTLLGASTRGNIADPNIGVRASVGHEDNTVTPQNAAPLPKQKGTLLLAQGFAMPKPTNGSNANGSPKERVVSADEVAIAAAVEAAKLAQASSVQASSVQASSVQASSVQASSVQASSLQASSVQAAPSASDDSLTIEPPAHALVEIEEAAAKARPATKAQRKQTLPSFAPPPLRVGEERKAALDDTRTDEVDMRMHLDIARVAPLPALATEGTDAEALLNDAFGSLDLDPVVSPAEPKSAPREDRPTKRAPVDNETRPAPSRLDSARLDSARLDSSVDSEEPGRASSRPTALPRMSDSEPVPPTRDSRAALQAAKVGGPTKSSPRVEKVSAKQASPKDERKNVASETSQTARWVVTALLATFVLFGSIFLVMRAWLGNGRSNPQIANVPNEGSNLVGSIAPLVAEPVVAEPVVAEPVVAEPAVAEPVVAEPVVAEPVVAEPVVAEPVVAEPAVAEPAVAEPAVAEPAVAEPAVAEPAVAEPVVAEPVVAEPVRAREETALPRPTHEGRDRGLSNRWMDRGRALMRNGVVSGAQDAFEMAQMADTQNPHAAEGLARIALARRNGAAALTHAERALSMRPRGAEYLVLLGDAHALLGHAAQAREAFERALAIDPNQRDALRRLGR